MDECLLFFFPISLFDDHLLSLLLFQFDSPAPFACHLLPKRKEGNPVWTPLCMDEPIMNVASYTPHTKNEIERTFDIKIKVKLRSAIDSAVSSFILPVISLTGLLVNM